MQREPAEFGDQHLCYRRSTVLWKSALCLIFLMLCVALLWINYVEYAGKLQTLPYTIAAIIGMWIVGPLFFQFVSGLTRRSTVLLSWNDEALVTQGRTVSWHKIHHIELASFGASSWMLSPGPMLALHLKDGKRLHIRTGHLLTSKELLRAEILLQLNLRENQQRDT
ncbi:hypothetical protein [Paenibacillus sp. ACRRY]|uniref:hypothetical protein n=1 Tax=Paenibacillus sp. ACRRY TaxID=2918208 RepID=UPI001EF3FA81|nr:hypothetical protein [Paenibacillus sp. ACRRY]MCG7384589.1 hypothetical protein [Paenibacillus sp. ACRRY]